MIQIQAFALFVGTHQLVSPPLSRLWGLYDAVKRGDGPYVSAEIDAGVSIDWPYTDGETLLMRAVADGRRPMLELLLKRGADPNRVDTDGCTALCFVGKPELAEDLLRSGAKIDGILRGTPPIVSAARGSSSVLRLLLKAGAQVDLRDRWGVTALIAAARQGKAENVRLLLRAGARRDLVESHGFRAVDFAEHQHRKDIVDLLKSPTHV